MIKVILIYLIIIGISILMGLNIVSNYTKSRIDKRINNQDISLDEKYNANMIKDFCEGGICSPPEEYKDGSD